jgi:hypothetical protein
VGFAVLTAVDVALQVHQEQPPHRRPPPLLPHPFQEQSNPTPPLDGYKRGRAKEPLQSQSPGRPETHAFPSSFDRDLGSGVVYCVQRCLLDSKRVGKWGRGGWRVPVEDWGGRERGE